MHHIAKTTTQNKFADLSAYYTMNDEKSKSLSLITVTAEVLVLQVSKNIKS